MLPEYVTLWEQLSTGRWVIVRTYAAHYAKLILSEYTGIRPLAGWEKGIDPNLGSAPVLTK